jgi:hypoxanthine phosphoribosyltransferase
MGIFKTFSEKQINLVVEKLAKRITEDYSLTDELILVGILKGSFIFLADLIRKIDLPVVKVEFMSVSSYINNVQGSEIKIDLDLSTSIADKDVLVIEDIIDSGKTLSKIIDLLAQRHPKSLKMCVLLNKKKHRGIFDMHIDYCGVEIPDVYPFGYGLDDKQFLRGLPFIAIK